MRVYSDPHNQEYGWVGNEWLPVGLGKPVTGETLNAQNQKVYQVPPSTTGYINIRPTIPEIDYAKLVDELLKRIRQDAGYRYELPGYPKDNSYDYGYLRLHADDQNAVNLVAGQNITYTKGNDPRDSAYSEWML